MRNLKDILDMRERSTYHLLNFTNARTKELISIDRALRWVLNELDDLSEVPSGDDFELSKLDE